VKPGRKVYLVLNANQPKMIDMPGLVDLSKRQAMSVLEIVGLKVKELQYRPDPCLDCVIEQRYKGLPIAANDKIRRERPLPWYWEVERRVNASPCLISADSPRPMSRWCSTWPR
jgi:hypothetical protein